MTQISKWQNHKNNQITKLQNYTNDKIPKMIKWQMTKMTESQNVKINKHKNKN